VASADYVLGCERLQVTSCCCCLQELEDQNRGCETEIAELRELRDQEGFSVDVKSLELELKVCTVLA
jgi:hypothetical protein